MRVESRSEERAGGAKMDGRGQDRPKSGRPQLGDEVVVNYTGWYNGSLLVQARQGDFQSTLGEPVGGPLAELWQSLDTTTRTSAASNAA